MKKIAYFLLAIATFGVGIVSYYLRPLAMPVSLREIKKNFGLYKSHKIKIRALMIAERRENSNEININLLDSKNPFTGIGSAIGLDVSDLTDVEISSAIKKLADKTDELKIAEFHENGWYAAEVEVTGILSEEHEDVSHPIDVIKAEEFKMVSPIKFIQLSK